MKLLIAEDDLTSRTMLAAVIRKWGFEPVAVEDGEAAWEALQGSDPPRLLLLDWMMPRLDGIALCRRVRQRASNDPPFIILLTARTGTGALVEGLDAGANDYIAKPYESAELQARLRVGQRMLDLQAELNQAHETLAFQATHDSLTGLLDRGAIMEALEQEMSRAQREQHDFCIGLCDIDHFKQVNDTYGHLAGDTVLREVSRRLGGALRRYDMVGRYGGEEFLIVVNSRMDPVQHPFDRIRRSIAGVPFECEQGTVNLTMSCGVAVFAPPRDEIDANRLITAADAALYEAKAAGRNRTVLARGAGCVAVRLDGARDGLVRVRGSA